MQDSIRSAGGASLGGRYTRALDAGLMDDALCPDEMQGISPAGGCPQLVIDSADMVLGFPCFRGIFSKGMTDPARREGTWGRASRRDGSLPGFARRRAERGTNVTNGGVGAAASAARGRRAQIVPPGLPRKRERRFRWRRPDRHRFQAMIVGITPCAAGTPLQGGPGSPCGRPGRRKGLRRPARQAPHPHRVQAETRCANPAARKREGRFMDDALCPDEMQRISPAHGDHDKT